MNLAEFYSNGYQSNAYFIDDDKKLLIDAGQFLEGIDPDILFLTHCHLDHIECAKEIQEKTGCEIWTSKVEADFFEADRENASASKFFSMPIDLEFNIDKKLNDKDIIELGTTNLELILTPGHTPGGSCLYDKETKVLFSGDTIFSSGFGRYDLLGGDLDDLRNSIERLCKLDIDELYPAHGSALTCGVNEYIRSIRI